MNNFIKYIKSNIGFLITLIFVALVAFNPKVKGLVLSGLIKTGLYEPDVSLQKPIMAGATAENATTTLVPSVLFRSSDGSTTDLADLKGKVIFLNFWATWCPPCVAEMPSINSLFNKIKDKDNVVFILVDADGNFKKSTAFMKNKEFDLPVFIPAGGIPEQLFRGSLPTTIIINKKGEIVFNHEGMADYNSGEMEKFLIDLAK